MKVNVIFFCPGAQVNMITNWNFLVKRNSQHQARGNDFAHLRSHFNHKGGEPYYSFQEKKIVSSWKNRGGIKITLKEHTVPFFLLTRNWLLRCFISLQIQKFPDYSLSGCRIGDFEVSLTVEWLDSELMRFYCLEQLVRCGGPWSLQAAADLQGSCNTHSLGWHIGCWFRLEQRCRFCDAVKMSRDWFENM